MISFGSVSALQVAMPQARNEILNEGKLSIGGKEYQINAATQEFTRTNPTNGAVARFLKRQENCFAKAAHNRLRKPLQKPYLIMSKAKLSVYELLLLLSMDKCSSKMET